MISDDRGRPEIVFGGTGLEEKIGQSTSNAANQLSSGIREINVDKERHY